MGNFLRELFWGLATLFSFLVGLGSLILAGISIAGLVVSLDRTVFQELSILLLVLIGMVCLATCAILSKLEEIKGVE